MVALSPRAIYDALIGQGASTTQAGGILANVKNESGFDPEAIGDQGSSFGIVQQHGNYNYLVTGNTAADLAAQVSLLKRLGGFQAAAGSSVSEAAGNFAASYERCVGCQPGGAQWQSRVSNAATVENWITTGNWPTSAGTPAGTPAETTGIHIPGTPFTIPTPGDYASGLASGFLDTILKAFGIGSLKDLMERLGLIILGFALVLLGIHILATGSRKAQPINITTETSKGPEGTTTNRKIKTPVSEHRTTTSTGVAKSGALRTGATEAAEAAAVALCHTRYAETTTAHTG
jgi:hypothetical protein